MASATRRTPTAPLPAPVQASRKPRAIRAVEGETKTQKFARLCQLRTANALKAIRLIGQLSAPQYGWNPDQLQQVHSVLESCMEDTFSKFRRSAHAPKPEATFKLILAA